MGRGQPISPLQVFRRSVAGNPVGDPVAAKKLREFLPVVRRFDGESRRLPPVKLQNWIGTSAKDPRHCRCNTTRSRYAHQGWRYDIKSEWENVLRFRIRHGATAYLSPKRAGI